MKSARRIVSDARYTISSIALVTGLALLASIGTRANHKAPAVYFEPAQAYQVEAPVQTSSVQTSMSSSECSCSVDSTTSTVQVEVGVRPSQSAKPADSSTTAESQSGTDVSEGTATQSAADSHSSP